MSATQSNNIIYRGTTCTIEDVPGKGQVVKRRLPPTDGDAIAAMKSEHRFRSEASILHKACVHPNIVPIEGERIGNTITLQKASHGTLKNFLEQYGFYFSAEQRHRWCRQLVDAVDYLHKLGIVHGDLSAENILVHLDAARDEFVLWISDFGDSAWLEARMLAGMPGFTLLSQPVPESRTLRADIYKLGVLIHIITTDKWPHHVPTNEEQLLEELKRKRYEDELQDLYPLEEFKLDESEFTATTDLSSRRAMIRCMVYGRATTKDVMGELMYVPGRL